MAKWMWIIAGPNGAGKSTFTGVFLADLGHPGLLKLNADERTAELRKQNPGAPIRGLNLQAAKDIDAQVAAAIEKGRSLCVETVLSSDKYRDDVDKARSEGFRIGIIYISIWPPELSPERIKDRVAKGGHDVETQTAIRRYKRSHEQLTWFAGQADQLLVFDNSQPGCSPVLIATGRRYKAALEIHAGGINPAVDHALNIRLLGRRGPGDPSPG